MKSVATRNVIASDLAGLAILAIANDGSIGLESNRSTSSASYTVGAPIAARASIRSRVTSVWP